MADKDKHRLVIELDRDTHDRLKAVASHYAASVRGTIVRYVKAGLDQDPFQTPKAAGDGQ